jgi:UTP--glucose-1-phosphate uridylyltransferase
MTTPPRTAVFPVAGLGTRFLPATKSVPKELLPVLDTPLIQFAVDEALEAGMERLVFVSHPSKAAIEHYLARDGALDAALRARGKDKVAERLEALAPDPSRIELRFVMQGEALGLGHAVLQAREHVEEESFAVILPDDLILDGEAGCLSEMAEAYEGGHMVAAMEVGRDEVSAYGVLDPLEREGRLTRARGLVEKPAPEEAPSRLAVVGRYILDSSIFETLASQAPGAGGEIQLTDAMARDIPRLGLAGFEFSGLRFDCGNEQGMLAAQLHLARRDPKGRRAIAEAAPPEAGSGKLAAE